MSPLQLAALATLAAVLALVCAALSLFCVGALVRAHRIELDHAETRRLLAAAGRRAPPPVPDDCR